MEAYDFVSFDGRWVKLDSTLYLYWQCLLWCDCVHFSSCISGSLNCRLDQTQQTCGTQRLTGSTFWLVLASVVAAGFHALTAHWAVYVTAFQELCFRAVEKCLSVSSNCQIFLDNLDFNKNESTFWILPFNIELQFTLSIPMFEISLWSAASLVLWDNYLLLFFYGRNSPSRLFIGLHKCCVE